MNKFALTITRLIVLFLVLIVTGVIRFNPGSEIEQNIGSVSSICSKNQTIEINRLCIERDTQIRSCMEEIQGTEGYERCMRHKELIEENILDLFKTEGSDSQESLDFLSHSPASLQE